jgi:hypothetical protein
MCFLLRNESVGFDVQVAFENPAAQRFFSTRTLLERQYEAPLPARIMVRLAVLKAAPSLAAVPQTPPFSLRRTGTREFVVDLASPRVLRLKVDRDVKLTEIKAVTVLGVA